MSNTENVVFCSVGKKFKTRTDGNECVLISISSNEGMFVCTDTWNRHTSARIPLSFNHHVRKFGIYVEVDNPNLEYAPIIDSHLAITPPKSADSVASTSFARFLRPINPKTGVIDNMKGVTLLFRLDYVSRRIIVGYSICDGDNFCKRVGIDLALYRSTYDNRNALVFPMPFAGYYSSEYTLVDDVVNYMKSFARRPVEWTKIIRTYETVNAHRLK